MKTIKIKQLKQTAIIPSKAHPNDAGFDLYAANDIDIWIAPNSTVLIPTGWAMEIPQGYFGGIYARSGLATKQGLRPCNCVGVIDSDYRGEIMVAIHNDSLETQVISIGAKIAQLILHKIDEFVMIPSNELNNTERGTGGFGSSGN